MDIIEASSYIVTEGRRAFVFATSDEVATIPLKKGETLVPLDIKPGDGLVLWLKDPAENDDGFKIFTVSECERVFAIATIASLSIVR